MLLAGKQLDLKKRWPIVAAWVVVGVLSYLTLDGFYAGFLGMVEKPTLASRRYLVYLGICTLAALVWLVGLWLALIPRPMNGWRALRGGLARLPRVLRRGAAILLLAAPTIVFLFTAFGHQTFGYWFYLGCMLAAAGLAALVWAPAAALKRWLLVYAGAVCAAGAFFAAGGWLNNVTGYPFSLNWSEGNRFWDFSMLFGKDRYITMDDKPIFTFISVGRQFLWALPFLFPGVTITLMRLWDASLWIWPPLLLGWLVIVDLPADRRLRPWKLVFVVWAFLFLAQGPIYAPLVVSAILTVVGLRQKKLGWGIFWLILASYYAFISRWTWLYAPGLWAGSMALLEVREPGLQRRHWPALVRPLALGLAGLFGGQGLPPLVNWFVSTVLNAPQFMTTFDPVTKASRQPLVWERLWPNNTYHPGIVLGFLWAFIPLALVLIALWRTRNWRGNWLQLVGVLFPGLAFWGVGMIASTKIGGGSNLHNLDMFWIFMVLVAGWALKNLLQRNPAWLPARPAMLAFFCLALTGPTSYAAQYNAALSLPPQQIIDHSLEIIRTETAKALERGPVLYMDQRQLLTFDFVQNVPLMPEYEKKYLMDQAMEGNPKYFERFYQDLAAHRFTLIVSEPLRANYISEGADRNFSDENNAWVKWVSEPVLKYYRPLVTMDEVGVQLLVPIE